MPKCHKMSNVYISRWRLANTRASARVSGLVDLFQNGPTPKINIEPFPPGVVETYDLTPSGTVKLSSSVRYQEIGQAPIYKTIAVIKGTRLLSLSLHISVVLEVVHVL